jgi:hypothetical protein
MAGSLSLGSTLSTTLLIHVHFGRLVTTGLAGHATICINEWKRREKMERRIFARLAPPQQLLALVLLDAALMAILARQSSDGRSDAEGIGKAVLHTRRL